MMQPRLLANRYELEGLVGRGSIGEVYLARDLRFDRSVAVKALRPDLTRDLEAQARFRLEAQSAASLNHPAIVAVYDTDEDRSAGVPVPFIVMEYVDGRTVRDLLVEGHRLLPERDLEIVSGVLRALEYSHQAGIVHRDIKPGNVMVTRNGDIKVMDFGISRALAEAAALTTTEGAGFVVGTVLYMSPEVARGERADARSDLYSTGCLMYEMLTGRPPFTGDSPVAITLQQVRDDPVPPSTIDPSLPPWADSIVFKAMAKSPSDRYQSAAEMNADIQRAASGLPVAAPIWQTTRGPAARAKPRSRSLIRAMIGAPSAKASNQALASAPSWGVFLSYRREDAGPYARLLQFQLRERLAGTQVFMDMDSIEPGLDFSEIIGQALNSCAVVVVLIGRRWATLTDEDGRRRLDNPDDYVLFEVQTALERGIRVIPVLVDGARPLQQSQLPTPLRKLARLNATELSYSRYEYDADRLLELIKRVIDDPTASRP